MSDIQLYLDFIGTQLVSTRDYILLRMSNYFSITKDQAQIYVVIVLMYIILIYIIGKFHRYLYKKSIRNLGKYTLTFDTIIYQLQKATYNNQSGGDISWIKDIIQSGSYLHQHKFLLSKLGSDNQVISPDTIRTLNRQLGAYKKANGIQELIGRLLTIMTLGTYKIFWK